ncbi:MAG: 2-dehydropantoate 2-reductase [Chloroflexota bacterium]|jgi:2-dehydropantoate 2-reductase|nr:2-dehydropantoate 2-reductase [Chloroflexota bacterium]
MGAGAVGGYYGGALALAGHDVTLVARGAHLAALQNNGLELREQSGTTHVPVRAVADPAESGPASDLVLFTVKAYDTDTAIEAVRPAVGESTTILPLQNGVDAADRLGAAFGMNHVLPGTTNIYATVVEPGVIIRRGDIRTITLGEVSGEETPRLTAIAAVLREAGVNVVIPADIQAAVWEKFILLAANACLSTASEANVGEVFREPEGPPLFRTMLCEVEAVARAAGVAVAPDIVERIMTFSKSWAPDSRTSMQVDYERKRRVELEQIAGVLVRRARDLGVATPTFDVLYPVLRIRARAFGGLD